MHYGLGINETRKLAYEFAVMNGKNVKDNWGRKKWQEESGYLGSELDMDYPSELLNKLA